MMLKILSKKIIVKPFAAFILLLAALPANAQVKITAEEYIEKFAPIAIEEMKRTGIPASIKLGQGLLESSMGNSRLAREANNHFGIKCKKNWEGRSMREDDDEKQECFRAYDSAVDSYRDHSVFLMQNSRYAFLFDYGSKDYKKWAEGLKKAGYATDPAYPQKLITAIEKHELHRFDEGVMPVRENPIASTPAVKDQPKDPVTETENEVIKFNKITAVQVHKGQTAASVAKEFGMRPWQIYKYNDLAEGSDLVPGSIIYLKPKKRKGSEPYHTVKEGETMYAISQLYGIKLNHLYKKNQMNAGQQPAPGEVMYLRKKRNNAPTLADTAKTAREIEVVTTKQPEAIKKELVVPDEKNKVSEIPPVDKEKIIALQLDTVSTPKEEAEAGNDVKNPVYSETSSDSTFETKVEEKQPTYAVDKKMLDDVNVHTVKEGETLFAIAKQHNKSVEALKSMNNLETYDLKPGQQLIINDNYKETKPDISHTSFYHEVQKGQTLFSIAKLYNLSVDELKHMNKLESDQLSLGQKLYVYKAAKSDQSRNTETLDYQYHQVQAGETLYGISKKYSISVDSLKKMNDLQGNDLAVGQRLRVK